MKYIIEAELSEFYESANGLSLEAIIREIKNYDFDAIRITGSDGSCTTCSNEQELRDFLKSRNIE